MNVLDCLKNENFTQYLWDIKTDHNNNYIIENELFDIPIGWFKFTQSNGSGHKMSNLYIFLVTTFS